VGGILNSNFEIRMTKRKGNGINPKKRRKQKRGKQQIDDGGVVEASGFDTTTQLALESSEGKDAQIIGRKIFMINVIFARGGFLAGLLALGLAMSGCAEAPADAPKPAESNPYRVYLASSRQAYRIHPFDPLAANDSVIARIYLPGSPKEPDGPTKGADFYVVVQNVSTRRIRLAWTGADWDTCLSFTIKGPGGKVYTVWRDGSAYSYMNPLWPWILEPGGMRVFEVNFSSGWNGVPTVQEIDASKQFKIQASFSYPGPVVNHGSITQSATSDWVDATWSYDLLR